MLNVPLFPFQEYWWFYAGFTAFVLVLLAVDLGVFHRRAHAVRFKEAALWCVVWVLLALTFDYVFHLYMEHRFALDPRLMAIPGFDPEKIAHRTALEFLAGYVVEYSLSIDNIFVFVIVLRYFRIPGPLQHRVLFFGILGALLFRGIFVGIGAVLLRYQWMVWIFGLFLVVTGVKLFFGSSDAPPEPEKNAVIRLFRRFVPVTHDLHGNAFFVRRTGGGIAATPLVIAVLFLEMTDILFAVDSVPAIFALTREPLVVFTSNVFAILGLRNLYFLLANAMDAFHLLSYGLGIILVFVGLKMTVLHVSIGVSLAVIAGVLAVAIAASLAFPRRQTEEPS
jgi:tellurite resistance protein TerC